MCTFPRDSDGDADHGVRARLRQAHRARRLPDEEPRRQGRHHDQDHRAQRPGLGRPHRHRRRSPDPDLRSRQADPASASATSRSRAARPRASASMRVDDGEHVAAIERLAEPADESRASPRARRSRRSTTATPSRTRPRGRARGRRRRRRRGRRRRRRRGRARGVAPAATRRTRGDARARVARDVDRNAAKSIFERAQRRHPRRRQLAGARVPLGRRRSGVHRAGRRRARSPTPTATSTSI